MLEAVSESAVVCGGGPELLGGWVRGGSFVVPLCCGCGCEPSFQDFAGKAADAIAACGLGVWPSAGWGVSLAGSVDVRVGGEVVGSSPVMLMIVITSPRTTRSAMTSVATRKLVRVNGLCGLLFSVMFDPGSGTGEEADEFGVVAFCARGLDRVRIRYPRENLLWCGGVDVTYGGIVRVRSRSRSVGSHRLPSRPSMATVAACPSWTGRESHGLVLCDTTPASPR